ncbi:hypothetical protein EG68_00923 [Paragonimus skrjabini miyazakii]|uniref:ANK_REP_REGION domain-containing protein n=1 Tax=Paragonimus skrjabini miyazakii TaxID=59628 RepID=A0A8S9ZB18_9TREM|nr:hypothetical protein EG68_00923 [Paragonimus skrjabini miyazakii]
MLVYLAAANGDEVRLEKLLKQENNVNFVDEATGMRPIHAAAAWGNPNCLKVLVNYGADVNQTDELLCTPLHHAARNGHTKTFEWLDENNADLVRHNLFGQSPADMALANDFPDLADQILRAALKQKKQLDQPVDNEVGGRATQ